MRHGPRKCIRSRYLLICRWWSRRGTDILWYICGVALTLGACLLWALAVTEAIPCY
jgi:hypothetical protein